MSTFAHIYRPGVEQNMLYSWFSAMHTRVDIIIMGKKDKDELLCIIENIHDRIAEIESIGNCFDPSSELSQLNAGLITKDDISHELTAILDACDHWKETTGGLFDVAVEGRINLSGFLKGYALDAIKTILEKHGINNALINCGNSSVLAVGSQHRDGEGWRVANINGEQFVLHDECLTTSGNDSPERRHIINPLTHQYVEGQRMISVVTKGGAEGEVKSTVGFLSSLDQR